MSTIRIFRPKRHWSVSPATVLPTGLLLRLFKPHWNYTVILDDHSAGKIGDEQVRSSMWNQGNTACIYGSSCSAGPRRCECP